MLENDPVLAQAEAIARAAKREDMDRIVKACEESNDPTLRSLARAYRMLRFG
jgi:hypothetical protein